MDDKRAAFNQQMNEWVSRQGLWFQLRHAADGQSKLSKLARLAVRFLILLLVSSLVFWVYLVRRVGSEGFKEGVRDSMEITMKGEECKLGAIRKDRDKATVSWVEMKGTEDSFFDRLNARLIRLDMKLTDGMFGRWNGGGITIERLELDLKAGAHSDAAAAKAFEALFDQHSSFEFDRIEVNSTNLNWGYSPKNRGSIQGSHMMAFPEGDGWTLEFSGGTFSQNWLRGLEIEKLVATCNRDGVVIQEAVLRSGGGTLTFNIEMGDGGQPTASGSVILDSMPVKALLPASYGEWIEGTISGEGAIAGSTNSQEGIILDWNMSLKEGDVLVLRDSLPLLSALSVVDVYNSYRKISFDQGGFQMVTGGGSLRMNRLNLKAGGLLHLDGALVVRPSTYKEVAEALDIGDVLEVKNVIEKNWKFEDSVLESRDATSSLSQAAQGIGDVEFDAQKSNGLAALDVRFKSILSEKQVVRFAGMIRVGLKPDAFDKAPGLKRAYPVDDATSRIWLDVPLTGRLQTLTLEKAKELYTLGRERR